MTDNARIIGSRFRVMWDIYRPGANVKQFLSVLALYGVAYGLYRGVQDNYLAEVAQITAFERGIVEFFRELPGLLVVFLLAMMYRLAESSIFKIGVALMTAGLVGLLVAGGDKLTVVLFMVVFSFGEHIVMPVRTTMTLDMAQPDKGGAALGITSAIGNLGNIAGFVIVPVLFALFSRCSAAVADLARFRIVFAVATALMLAAVLVSLALKESKIKVKKRRFYFARKFYKFYMLEIFYGARKQIFLTFAPYVLILQYGAGAPVISLLLAVCAVFGFILSPFVGRLIDRIGYKTVMVADTLILVAVCFLYGFSHRIFPPQVAYAVVLVNFVLDSVISLASMATNVYVQRISSSKEEMTATISTGISVNHGISIFIALLGGYIWKVTGIEVLFSLSAFFGLLNSAYAATITEDE